MKKKKIEMNKSLDELLLDYKDTPAFAKLMTKGLLKLAMFMLVSFIMGFWAAGGFL